MPDKPKSEVAEFYRDRHVFYTGATGFVGTVCLSRLVLETPVARVYAVVRGGERRLWDIWRKLLPLDLVRRLQTSQKLIIFDGDITQASYGLKEKELKTVYDTASIFIHGASTIDLQLPVQKAIHQIIHPSARLAEIALRCPKLINFTFISTAYANAFLRYTEEGVCGADAAITEDIVSIIPGSERLAREELLELEESGMTAEYKSVQHPYSYSYAKHLAERLLLQMFEEARSRDKLLIFRPSCVGPTISKPFPFFEIAGSAPLTTFMASLIASPPTELVIATQLKDPANATIDEVPADIVANRLIVHISHASYGCVHAVSGRRHRQVSEAMARRVALLRSHWRGYPTVNWIDDDWKSKEQWTVAKRFVIFGTSFLFEDGKTDLAWERMTESDRSLWPLWPSIDLSCKEYVMGRSKTLVPLIHSITKKNSGRLKSVSRISLGPLGPPSANL